MLIAGLQKNSFVDYPKKLCAVVFTPGCNMNCWYCHNRHIISGEVDLVPEREVLDYLERRKELLDAVVITGGEPTQRPDLRKFIEKVRRFGYLVKLDTNGTNPMTVAQLLSDGLLDYVAMDIKAPLDKYETITDVKCDIGSIRQSINLLINCGVPYEFRTTFAPSLEPSDAALIAEDIAGAERYYIQQYRKVNDADPEPHPPSAVILAAKLARDKLGFCETRGL